MSQPLLEAEQQRVDSIRENGVDVIVVSPDSNERSVKALIGSTDFEQFSDNGMSIITKSVDFLIPTADLTEEITKSHKVEFLNETYEPGTPDRTPFLRQSGRFGLVVRVHTVRKKKK